MSEKNFKPYEVSIWEEELVNKTVPVKEEEPEGETVEVSYYKENKLAVIASDSFTSPNSAYNIVFKKSSNGERILSFSIKNKYYDVTYEQEIRNPFCGLLVNERKVKLKYDGKWYDFIIKECNENSEEYEWTYTAYDAAVLELSKNGYDVTFNTELDNNQGSALDLALKTLKDTNWDVIDIDVAPPKLKDAVYLATTHVSFEAHKLEDDEIVIIPANTEILIFYSFVANKTPEFFQFVRLDEEHSLDDDNVLIGKNYRLDRDVVYINDKIAFAGEEVPEDNYIIQYNTNIITDYQAYKYIYKQITTYDSVMKRTVFEYDAKGTRVYQYKDYDYTTSDVVVSYVTNGNSFEVYGEKEKANLQGWNRFNNEEANWPDISLTTYPQIDIQEPLMSLDKINQIEGFLEVKFHNDNDNFSYLCNTGINNHQSIIGSISKGQKFLFRYSGGLSAEQHGNLTSLNEGNIKAIVTSYETKYNTADGHYHNEIDLKNPIFVFDGVSKKYNNKITNGEFRDLDYTKYYVDGVVVEPSTNYVYEYDGISYIWDANAEIEGEEEKTGRYIKYEDGKFLDYYYIVANAQNSVTSETLKDPTKHIGIFLYTDNDTPWYYLRDIQLTKYYEDANENPVLIGNVPVATSQATDYFYVAPKNGDDPDMISTYADIDSLAEYLEIEPEDIKPLYNTDTIQFMSKEDIESDSHILFYVDQGIGYDLYELFHVRGYALSKILSIDASHSNCFNILQTIAETFECWVDLQVEHEENGAIQLDRFGRPQKEVYLRNYIGKDNYSGFKYGVNLSSIERTVDSNEIVTKLIVNPAQCEYVDRGVVSIQYAESNVSKESYILNFDYYFKHGLLNKADADVDINNFNQDIRVFNDEIDKKSQERIQLEAKLTKLTANRDVYSTLIDTAVEKRNEALDDFVYLTGYTYETYQKKTAELNEDNYYKYLLTDDTEVKPGKIYYEYHEEGQTEEEKYKRVDNPEGNPKEDHGWYENFQNLLKIESITDIIGVIYTNSVIINNYSGLLVNTQTQYKEVYQALNGNPSYIVTVTRIKDFNQAWHVNVDVSDYIEFGFTLDGESYKTSVNKKNFDIETNEILIHTITYDEANFDFVDSDGNRVESIIVDEHVAQKFKLKPKVEQKSLAERIDDLVEEKKKRIKDFYNKYSRFILEGTWDSTDYLSDEMYYLDALQTSNLSAYPKVSYNISVVDIGGLEGYEAYEFDAGDKTFVEDTEFFGWNQKLVNDRVIRVPAREEVVVSEIEWHLDDPSSNTITVQNYKTRFEDLFQRLQSTVQTVQYNEVTYAKTNSIIDENGVLREDVLMDSLNLYSGFPHTLTTDGSIVIDGDRMIIRNLRNASDLVRLSSGGISVSADGGLTWSTAITGKGVSIQNLLVGNINTDRITIGGGNSSSFRWDSNGLSAYQLVTEDIYQRTDDTVVVEDKAYYRKVGDEYEIVYGVTGNPHEQGYYEVIEGRYNFNKYVRFDQYGLYGIEDNAKFVASDLDDVKDNAYFAITWDGFFIRNSYTDGRVEITSDDDFRVVQTINDEDKERIKIGAIGRDAYDNPIYGIRVTKIEEGIEVPVFVTGQSGDITITGTINATGGNFSKLVTVGKNSPDQTVPPWIEIDGENAWIKSSNYSDDSTTGSTGWFINSDGDAVFNNIIARGAIKTAVFEYAEIEAVGGIFLFRPSTSIRSASVSTSDETDQHVYLKVEKALMFAKDDWCKVSNVTPSLSGGDSAIGLIHVYKVSDVDLDKNIITLADARDTLLRDTTLESLAGGALINIGVDITDTRPNSNYGIGINSSDNTMELPRRAISLFESVITPEPKNVVYNLRGVLGTIPDSQTSQRMGLVMANDVAPYMYDTQGIYTNNMYLGNDSQYITFYTDKETPAKKHLKIESANLKLNDDGAYINGEIVANAGYIGGVNGWAIESQKLHSGSLGSDESMWLATTDLGDSTLIGGREGSDWRLTVGSKFGITNNGSLYASNVELAGKITATSGKIGNWDITNSSIQTGAYDTSDTMYFGSSGLSLSNTFKVSSSGVLTAIGADIKGKITATDGKIGNWDITNSSIQTGGYDTSGNMYFGSQGLSISNTFKVSNSGALSASSVSITGGSISIGSSFSVNSSGALSASSVSITGGSITIGSNFSVNNSGNLTANNVFLGISNGFNTRVDGSAISFYSGGTLLGSMGAHVYYDGDDYYMLGAVGRSQGGLVLKGSPDGNCAKMLLSPSGKHVVFNGSISTSTSVLVGTSVSVGTSLTTGSNISAGAGIGTGGSFYRTTAPGAHPTTYDAVWWKNDSNNYHLARPSSSRQYKKDIKDISDPYLDPHKLYNVRVVQFRYKENYKDDPHNSKYNPTALIPGFIAEEIAETYPVMGVINENGEIDDWFVRHAIPPMLKLIQEQHEEIELLKQEIATLK